MVSSSHHFQADASIRQKASWFSLEDLAADKTRQGRKFVPFFQIFINQPMIVMAKMMMTMVQLV